MIDLPEPDVRHIRPIRGVRDDTAAQAIEGLGTLALDFNSKAKQNALQGDLEGIQSEVLSSAGLTEEEQSSVDNFSSKMAKLTRMSKTGLSETDYRIRAEAALKEHITAAPALASELRQRAGQVLGFDPTGSKMDSVFAAQEAVSAANEKAFNAKVSQASRMNMSMNDVGSPRWEREYEDRLANLREADSIKTKSVVDTRDLNVIAGAVSTNVEVAINTQTQELFGTNFDTLTPAQLAGLSQEERAGFISRLENLKFTLSASNRAAYPTANNIDAALSPAIGRIDSIIARIDPNQDHTSLENKNKITMATVRSGFLNTPTGLAVATMSESAPNVVITGQLALDAERTVMELAGGVYRGNPSTDKGENDKHFKEVSSFVDQWTRAVDPASLTPDQKGAWDKYITTFSQALEDEEVSPNSKQAILDIYADDGAKEFLKSMPKTGEGVAAVIRGAQSYAVTTSIAAGRALQENTLTPTSFRQRGKPTSKPSSIKVRMVDGVIVVEPIGNASVTKARKLRNSYAKRINTAIAAIANGADTDKQTAALRLFQSNPSAFAWIIEGAQIEGITDE